MDLYQEMKLSLSGSPLGEYVNQKVKTIQQLQELRKTWRTEAKKLVFTNGCFDILHNGHVHYLWEAKALGDILVVAANTDVSVKRIKDSTRPINSQKDRLLMLACLAAVDYVTWFAEDTPTNLIQALLPDILVKGGDWPDSKIVGKDIVEAAGGRALSLALISNYSTSRTIQKIQDLRPAG